MTARSVMVSVRAMEALLRPSSCVPIWRLGRTYGLVSSLISSMACAWRHLTWW